MDTQKKSILLDEIGGEPLDGSGFETETGAFEDEDDVAVPLDQQEDE
jgi:hypothetical protein